MALNLQKSKAISQMKPLSNQPDSSLDDAASCCTLLENNASAKNCPFDVP